MDSRERDYDRDRYRGDRERDRDRGDDRDSRYFSQGWNEGARRISIFLIIHFFYFRYGRDRRQRYSRERW